MARLTLTEYIDDAMTRSRTDGAQIERETGVPASWIRNLKAGRIKNRPDAQRLRLLAGALKVPEAELWTYLGRMDMVASLRQRTDAQEDGTATVATSDLAALVVELREWRTEDRVKIAALERTVEGLLRKSRTTPAGEVLLRPPARRRKAG